MKVTETGKVRVLLKGIFKMGKKVLLILVDGMRPDAVAKCPHPFIKELQKRGSYTAEARTVMPSVTLPCHMSLFHSVTPQRHGVTTNQYVPQVRPVKGIFDVLRTHKKISAMFFDWEELRDLGRPDALAHTCFYSGHIMSYEKANLCITDDAVEYMKKYTPDFAFLYLGFTDEAGHDFGWMTDEYMRAVNQSWDCIERVVNVLSDEYAVIITADHGGHERSHGTEMPEDMTIPMFAVGDEFAAGGALKNISIMDIAPTVVKILNLPPEDEWEGKPLF